jgi:hypothetical protein
MLNVFAMLEFVPSFRYGRRTAGGVGGPAAPAPREAVLMFKFGSAELSDDAAISAGIVAEAAFYNLPERKIRVIGYASAQGGSAYNERLSKERARRVARYLELHGVPADRIGVEWRGGVGGSENKKAVITFE